MATIRHKMGHWSSDFPSIDPDVRIRPRHDRGGEDHVHVHVDVPSDPIDRWTRSLARIPYASEKTKHGGRVLADRASLEVFTAPRKPRKRIPRPPRR